ncbi:MAG TPA: UDP binding domain-containing protein, partial [Thermoanaerobaculia bacterium]|nr:UDP binding domain-containing protein [Thermoanaerobaculia bacterium]
RDVLRTGVDSRTMRIPDVVMGASAAHHAQILAGLLRGDGDVEVTTRKRTYRKKGRLYRHQFNTGQVGYFSSSPELFAQTEALLQELGFAPIRKKGKPHLRLAGERNLARLAPLFDGEKARRLERLAAARIRPKASRRGLRWAGGTALRVESVSCTAGSADVYSLEVPGSHTFATTGGVFVHNCIPIDPFYLTWKAREYGVATRFIELAGEINTAMPEWVVHRVADALNTRGKNLKDSRILILGVAYKKNVDDIRESPALEIIQLLLARGAQVAYHDPHVPRLHKMRRYDLGLVSQDLEEKALTQSDAVVIITDHDRVDYELVARHSRLLVDTRAALRKRQIPADPERTVLG